MNAKAKAAEALAAGKEAVETVVATGTEAATKTIAQAQAVVKEQIDTAVKNASGVFSAVEDAVEFGKGNVEAVIKANQILVAGLQDLGKHAVANAQAAIEDGMATARQLAAVKSVKEAVELQGAFLRTAMEKAFANAIATHQTGLKLVESALAPVADRAKLAMEKFSRPMAA
jgi:phasin family protein